MSEYIRRVRDRIVRIVDSRALRSSVATLKQGWRQRLLHLFICVLVLVGLKTLIGRAYAAEGGISFYVPGLYGDAALAVAPEAGTYFFNTSIVYPAKAPVPNIPEAPSQQADAQLLANLLRAFWVPKTKFLGMTYLAGIRIQYLDVDAIIPIETATGIDEINGRNQGIGDVSLIPASLYWSWRDLHFNLYEVVSAPTGRFDANNVVNISLNRWVFDTVFSMSWLNKTRGLDLSFASGLTYSTENPSTDYQNGLEFHLDFMANRFLTESLAVGLHGSVYRQITADSGEGAAFGSFKGRSSSLGPALIFSKKYGNRNIYTSAKWLHEFGAKNHIQGSLYILTAGLKF